MKHKYPQYNRLLAGDFYDFEPNETEEGHYLFSDEVFSDEPEGNGTDDKKITGKGDKNEKDEV